MQFLTITEFTKQLKQLMENRFRSIMLQGEISSVTNHSSGHIYITLKDQHAVVSGVVWGTIAKKQNLKLHQGDHVELMGNISLYPPHGKYQVVVQKIRKKGVGNLHQAFEQMKQKLQQEGLFDLPKKKLPFLPKQIALITAQTGAAITDFINVAQRRNPQINILIFPTPVQGKGAAQKIAKMIQKADHIPEIDLIVVTRGGGSLEDLWSFNEEVVARAIAACNTPLLSAVGHERDFTIADFVADKRGATPSEAAELVSQEYQRLLFDLKTERAKLNHLFHNKLLNNINHIEQLKRRFQQAEPKIDHHKLRMQRGKALLTKQIQARLNRYQNELAKQRELLLFHHPQNKLQRHQEQLNQLKTALQHQISTLITTECNKITLIKRELYNRSPLTILNRGYSMVIDANGKLIASTTHIKKGDAATLKLKDGDRKIVIID